MINETGSLQGILALEFPSTITAQLVGMMLADAGAEVWKVESLSPAEKQHSADFRAFDSGKKSLAIDLQSVEGRRVALELAAKADVLIEGYTPGQARRLGIGYSKLARNNKKLVYCALPLFGEQGPLAEVDGDQSLVTAYASYMAYQGGPDDHPYYIWLPISSTSTALLAAAGINAALYARERDGEGQKVEVPLLNGTLALLHNTLVFSGSMMPRPGHGNIQKGVWPTYRLYRCQDDWIVIGAFNSTFWHKLCVALDRAELTSDPRFENAPYIERPENQDALVEILSDIFKEKPLAQWLDILTNFDVPCSRVHTLEEALAEPQVSENQLAVQIDTSREEHVTRIGQYLNFSLTPLQVTKPTPKLGEHTEEILRWLGYSERDVMNLRQSEIIF